MNAPSCRPAPSPLLPAWRDRVAIAIAIAVVVVAIVCLLLPGSLRADDPPASMQEKTQGMTRHTGLLDYYTEPSTGKVWLRLPVADAHGEHGRYLYFEALRSGLGSNPVGLDRSQLGETRLIRLRSLGGRVFLEQLNTRYRALSDDVDERRATEQSFATSVLWAGDIAARDDDGEVLVDFTSFLVRDAHGIVSSLQRSDQGSFSLDRDRSGVDLAACLAFPDNIVFEAMLTFQGTSPGREVRATTPEPEAITLSLHHCILRLPDDDYTPRAFDPRIGIYPIEFHDYAAALEAPLVRRWIARHRLEKVTPGAAPSRVVEPIVYHVDRGAPEPVRSALLDGARWWAAAFERAGFLDAFRVEVLPQDAHPLDIRYNVINWVHRATRGWSYGWGVIDPRTGEIIKGHVLLGSLRVRQDRLLFEGLAGTARTGQGGPDDPVQLALARIRQLSAHEVGHTLGVAHNFAASTYGRESVMDYPAPLVTLRPDGSLDFSQAYDAGIGEWDVLSIRYAYSTFDRGGEAAGLHAIVQDGLDRGLYFLSDQDARPAGAAQPRANLWDNGELAEDELMRLLEVRRTALRAFGQANIAPGQPLAQLEEVLVPVYFMHRYSLDAAAKVLGGVDYRYAVRGDGQPLQRPLPAARQQATLEALLHTLQPEQLDITDGVLQVVHPRAFGIDDSREQFNGHTRPMFDPVGAAQTLASLIATNLLQPQRCARLVEQHRRDPQLPGFDAVLERLRQDVFEGDARDDARLEQLRLAAQVAVVDALLELAQDEDASAAVRARTEWMLAALRQQLERRKGRDDAARAHQAWLAGEIARHQDRGLQATDRPEAPPPPPGSPIGGTERIPWALSGCAWGTP